MIKNSYTMHCRDVGDWLPSMSSDVNTSLFRWNLKIPMLIVMLFV